VKECTTAGVLTKVFDKERGEWIDAEEVKDIEGRYLRLDVEEALRTGAL
jgi:hypothetical protein